MERKRVPALQVPKHLQHDAVHAGKMELNLGHIKPTKSNCKGLILSMCILREWGRSIFCR